MLCATVLLIQQACVAPAERSEGAANEAELDLVAQNLVYTLAQLVELNPLSTTIQLSEPRTSFGRDIVRRIRDVGYGVQSVPDDRGRHYLRYRVQQTTSELSEETRYTVSIGSVSVERAYDRVDGRLVPVSELRVRGSTESTSVELNDDLFAIDSASPISTISFNADAQPSIVDATGIESPSTADVPNLFGARLKQNLYGRIDSNYAELFADYDDIDQDNLSFGNDSMRLGAEQKALIADYASRVNPQTDLISIVGCSHGSTSIDNGNSVLALGRTNRVKEALVYAGLSPERILDEGCWAGQYHATFPKRGVVMTLKRRRG